MAVIVKLLKQAFVPEADLVENYLSDERWMAVAPELPGKEGDPGCHGRNNRLFLEAVFWIARTRLPWRSLPAEFGKWYTIYTRYRRWEKKGIWPRVAQALVLHDGFCPFTFDARHGPRWEPPQLDATKPPSEKEAA